jgi:hypothetical protein
MENILSSGKESGREEIMSFKTPMGSLERDLSKDMRRQGMKQIV